MRQIEGLISLPLDSVSAAVICPEPELRQGLMDILTKVSSIRIVRVMGEYPNEFDLRRFLRARAPQVVFLSTGGWGEAKEVIRSIEATASGVQVIAVGTACQHQQLLELMRIGVREFIAAPFAQHDVLDALRRAAENLQGHAPSYATTDHVYSFLPAKAGVGATTLAVNTSLAISQQEYTRTLLCDFDLNSGLVRFMLKLDGGYSMIDAAKSASEIDEGLWPQLVSTIGTMDVIHAGKPNPSFRIESIQIGEILAYARRNYHVVVGDLSGNLEKFSLDIMQESRKIFLVVTPEVAALHLAREKLEFLRDLKLTDRMAVLVNRFYKRSMIGLQQIEELLGLPVFAAIPNDYQAVNRALTSGKPIESSSEAWKQCELIAKNILANRPARAAEPKRKFVEYFSISSARPKFDPITS